MMICNVTKLVSEFLILARKRAPSQPKTGNQNLILIRHPSYERMAATVDMDLALEIYNVYR